MATPWPASPVPDARSSQHSVPQQPRAPPCAAPAPDGARKPAARRQPDRPAHGESAGTLPDRCSGSGSLPRPRSIAAPRQHSARPGTDRPRHQEETRPTPSERHVGRRLVTRSAPGVRGGDACLSTDDVSIGPAGSGWSPGTPRPRRERPENRAQDVPRTAGGGTAQLARNDTDFVYVNSLSPSTPNSRPEPDRRMPPNGAALRIVPAPPLMATPPVRSCSAIS